ncbi:putative tannase and feruloyl esterase [Lyophyllum shimeji]|uniref:Carboxylic ester hydrolase n=1 Tax=Lyophyllum shimeji TaxID=47721 RepID=A0A9P3Q0T7_LYOSH|nr:putative tannase and feruloyl esterase [Lyophyllum shimeji]
MESETGRVCVKRVGCSDDVCAHRHNTDHGVLPQHASGDPRIRSSSFESPRKNGIYRQPVRSRLQHYGTYDIVARISLFVVNTTSTSSVFAEAWLPDTWYGRFLAVGNGGLGGCVDYQNIDYGTSLHFATVGSNNGHDGGSWSGTAFLNHPEVINDFAYRAIHVQTVIGKQIVQAYYGEPHHKSYWLEDFDGIVAGAPATFWNDLLGWEGMMARHVGAPNPNASASFIPPALWDVVAGEVLRQCDELDGVKDGIITEPDACEFRPEAIQCTGQNMTNCLSKPQVEALRKIYSPLYGLGGELLYPRYDPGTEGNGNWQIVANGSVNPLVDGWYRFAVLNDSNYNFSDFGLKEIALADRINPGGISTSSGDLSAFEKRGGKFITYHGRRDEYIPSGNSKRMYNLISETLSMPSLDSFYRLFLIPGMNHCSGGPGAAAFGQRYKETNAVNASSHNVLLAMVDWVEGGNAPDTIIGTATDGTQRHSSTNIPQV